MSSVSMIVRESRPRPLFLMLFFLGFMTLGWGIGNGYTGDEIQILVRFVLFLQVSIFAFVTSWMIFPQSPMWLTQSLNPSRNAILNILFGRTHLVTTSSLFFLSAIVLGVNDVGLRMRLFVLLDAVIFCIGLNIFSVSRFVSIGSSSQLWQEGRKGLAFINFMREAGSGGAGVPPGAIPTIIATSLVAIIGMMSVVFQSWVQGLTGLFIPGIAGLVLLFLGLITWFSLTKVIDTEFYHSHGFYSELFRNPGGRADGGRDPVPLSSLYWVPSLIKPATWLTFRQLDRKLPLGRLLVLVFIVYWGLIKSSILDDQALVSIPILMILAKNMILISIDKQSYSSFWYRRSIGSDFLWFGVHVATGLRWLVPIQFFLVLTVWFVEGLSQDSVMIWLVFDLSSILVIAVLRTIMTHYFYAKNYR